MELPVISGKDVVKAFEKLGYVVVNRIEMGAMPES